ncbi:MAG: helix-turn-helix transcriptional regulator [Oscillibacter sp.]|nr:helix-turn-helix transcriptional regulator [Oscillibacter sp.]
MSENYPTIYQKARKRSCLSQEQAADALHVSLKTIKAWEYGERTPSNADVMYMCEAYGTPWLALDHLRQTADMLQVLPGGITLQELPTAAITLYNRVMAFANKYRRTEQLLEIAEDGTIDAGERELYDQIVADLDGIISAALQIKFAEGIKKDRPTGGSVRQSGPQSPANDCKIIIPDPRENASPTFGGKEDGV